MWTLILTISLKSQFNHALDVQIRPNLPTEQTCLKVGTQSSVDLKSFNPKVEVKISCVEQL